MKHDTAIKLAAIAVFGLAALHATRAAHADAHDFRAVEARKAYREAYAAAGHKAFAQSAFGHWAWSAGHADAAGARAAALGRCNAAGGAGAPACVVFDADGKPVDDAAAREADEVVSRRAACMDQLLQGIGADDSALTARSVDCLERLPLPASTMSPRSPRHAAFGNRYLAQGRHEQAITAFRTAAELSPGVPDYQRATGDALRAAGRHAEAATAYRAALAIDLDDVAAWLGLADAVHRDGKPELAGAAVRAAHLLAGSSDARDAAQRAAARGAALEAIRKAAAAAGDAGVRTLYEESATRLAAIDPARLALPHPGRADRPFECAAPEYPPLLVRNGVEGVVRLSYRRDAGGKLQDIVVRQSSGNLSIDTDSIAAIAACRFPAAAAGGDGQGPWDKVKFVWRIE